MKQLIDIDRAKQLAMAVLRIVCSLFPSAVTKSCNQKRDNSATDTCFCRGLRMLCRKNREDQEELGRTGKNGTE